LIDINISENNKPCTNHFASIDCDDNNVTGYWNTDTNLSIIDFQKQISITPHHFDVNATLSNFNKGTYTYLSNDLNMSAKLDLTITAQNAQNVTTQNYNSGCYAKDTNYTINYTTTPSATANLNYFETNTSKADSNLTATSFVLNTIPSTLFSTDTNGTAKLNILVDFNRSDSSPVNPFDLNITSAIATDENSVTGSDTADIGTATFVYGRIHPYDIKTDQMSAPNPIEIEIYGKNSTATFLNSKPQNVLYWHRNTEHNTSAEGNITSGTSTPTTSIVVNTSNPPKSGVQSIYITNGDGNTSKQTINLVIPGWLSITPDNNTFQYQYIKAATEIDTLTQPSSTSKTGVNSGTFTGSDFEIQQSQQTTKKGIKVFR
jgi:hypothetical protein